MEVPPQNKDMRNRTTDQRIDTGKESRGLDLNTPKPNEDDGGEDAREKDEGGTREKKPKTTDPGKKDRENATGFDPKQIRIDDRKEGEGISEGK